jgi:hypothetical protein
MGRIVVGIEREGPRRVAGTGDRAGRLIPDSAKYQVVSPDAHDVRRLIRELAAALTDHEVVSRTDAQVDALLAEVMALKPRKRVAAVRKYASRYGTRSAVYVRFYERLVDVDPATADAVRPADIERITRSGAAAAMVLPTLPSEMLAEVISITLPAVSGVLADRVVGVTVDWLRRRASRRAREHTVRVYGPNGETISEVRVPAHA